MATERNDALGDVSVHRVAMRHIHTQRMNVHQHEHVHEGILYHI